MLSVHSDPLIDDSGAVPSDQDDKQEGEKMEKNKKKKGKVNKATKPQDDEGKGHATFGVVKSCDNDFILLRGP